jgi:hypothetical protein
MRRPIAKRDDPYQAPWVDVRPSWKGQCGDTLLSGVVIGHGKSQAEIDRDALLHLCGAETTVEGATTWLRAEFEGRSCSEEAIVTLLDELNAVAKQCTPGEPGLPLRMPSATVRLRTVVREWLHQQLSDPNG